MARRSRKAKVADIHEMALAMPGAKRYPDVANDIYQVGGKSFVYFRNPRPDAVDPDTGERYTDVVLFRTESEEEKWALVGDDRTPFFTTDHFNGYPGVLVRTSRIGELSIDELREVIQDAWLSRASKTARRKWLESHGLDTEESFTTR